MKKSKKTFFTLTEILVTVAIIAFLMGISIGGMSVALRIASEAKCKAMIKKFEMAAESYRSKVGYYPQMLSVLYFYMDTINTSGDDFNDFFPVQDSELKTITGSTTGRGLLKDPWASYYIYLNPGARNPTKFDFYSAGADGATGTTSTSIDDIGNFQ